MLGMNPYSCVRACWSFATPLSVTALLQIFESGQSVEVFQPGVAHLGAVRR